MTQPALPLNRPAAQGLYDPANEHDACGVGFVANIKGARSHGIIEQGLLILKNLAHRGAVGADPLASDAAHSDPDPGPVPARGNGGAGRAAAARGPIRRGHGVPAAGSGVALRLRIRNRARDQGRGAGAARLARCAARQLGPGRIGEEDRAGGAPGFHRPRQQGNGNRRAGAQALHHPQVFGPRDPGAAAQARQGVLRGVDVGAHARVQGPAARRSGGQVLQGSAGSAPGVGAGAGAPALLHQYFPDLGPRAPVPTDRPQRRDQHPARQRQLDPRAAAGDFQPDTRSRPEQGLAADLRRPVRFGFVRQCARAAGDVGLFARARDDDADSRGLGKAQHHGRQPACFL